ncbi:hypothetical protein KVT40_007459 [Elsinoe batatas]|uniref:Uncharacterized protein n=1 Tax=Elsinoe batatas TaxID=2601811 RepID=A0A8K0PDA1_9PEZI|nr:hypothetical protein KVT40_007459 [Elsinoe batatas]
MSSSNGTVVPLNIMAGEGSAGIVASVISANPTQTAMVVNCPAGTDGNDCGIYNLSITVGPWAAATPPPNLPATGRYEMYMAMDSGSEPDADGNEGFTLSIGCDVTSVTVPSVCTSINIGGNNDGVETSTFTNPDSEYALTLADVTFTAGAEKLVAASTATGSMPSSTGASSSGSAGSTSSAVSGSRSTSAGVSPTSSGLGASQTGAANVYGVNMGTMGLLALAVAFFTR